MKKINRLSRYTLFDYFYIGFFFALLAAAEAVRRLTPARFQIKWLQKNRIAGKNRPALRETVYGRLRMTLRYLEIADRQLGLSNACVRKALALKALTEFWGIPAQFKIGIAKDGNKIQAHGWLEWDGLKLEWFEDDPTVTFHTLEKPLTGPASG